MAEFTGATGTIHYGHWEPATPSSLVVFLHRLGEHIGSYQPMFDTLTAAGIAVWAADHAGHGRSAGERVLIKRVDDLLDDAARMVDLARAKHPDLPLVLVGHSLGAEADHGLPTPHRRRLCRGARRGRVRAAACSLGLALLTSGLIS